MSFFNIKNPVEREKTIKEYLATMKRIKNRNLRKKAHDFANYEKIDESLEPVVCSTATSTETITKELVPIKEQIEQMNKLMKPKAVKIGIKQPAEKEEPEQFEVNQPIKKQPVDR